MTPFEETKERHFPSPDELLAFISSDLITRAHAYGFRGHSAASWKLEPTLARFVDVVQASFPGAAADREGTTKLVLKRLESEFVKNLIINRDLTRERIANIDIWQYGQHFGLPSPLLDWTYSPYVALFFALWEPPREDSDGMRCVWTIDLDLIKLLNQWVIEEIRPKYQGRIEPERFLNEQFPVLSVVEEINETNRRLAFQQGFFTKHEYYRSLEVWLRRISAELAMRKADRPVLHKYTFECNERTRLAAMDKLDSMNINSRTLFPDIFGSVRGAMDATLLSFRSPGQKSFGFSS